MSFRKALQTYIDNPEKHGDSVVFSDADFVIIKDSFPKSEVHLLVMPRARGVSATHPLKALKDPKFYSQCAKYVEIAVDMAREMFGMRYKGELTVRVGVHAVPSMNNLHIHVLTSDMHSARTKNKKHYNSFNTRFFVPFKDIPGLNEGDDRLNMARMESLIKSHDLVCLFCGQNFKNQFAMLRKHLSVEFSKKFHSIS